MHELGAGWLFLGPERLFLGPERRSKHQSSLGEVGVQVNTNYLAFYHLRRSRQLRLQSIEPFDRSTSQIAARCLSAQRWFIAVLLRACGARQVEMANLWLGFSNAGWVAILGRFLSCKVHYRAARAHVSCSCGTGRHVLQRPACRRVCWLLFSHTRVYRLASSRTESLCGGARPKSFQAPRYGHPSFNCGAAGF